MQQLSTSAGWCGSAGWPRRLRRRRGAAYGSEPVELRAKPRDVFAQLAQLGGEGITVGDHSVLLGVLMYARVCHVLPPWSVQGLRGGWPP